MDSDNLYDSDDNNDYSDNGDNDANSDDGDNDANSDDDSDDDGLEDNIDYQESISIDNDEYTYSNDESEYSYNNFDNLDNLVNFEDSINENKLSEIPIYQYTTPINIPKKYIYNESYLGQEIIKKIIPHIYKNKTDEKPIIIYEILRKLELKKYNPIVKLPININILKLDCDEKLEILPEYLHTLIISPSYVLYNLPKIHRGIHTLYIFGNSCTKLQSNLGYFNLVKLKLTCNEKITITSLPKTLEYLELNCLLEGKLPYLPSNLLYFHSPKDYKYKLKYPSKLKTLIIGSGSCVYSTYNLPDSLENIHIKTGVLTYNNQLILPKQLKKINIDRMNFINKLTLDEFIEEVNILTQLDEICFNKDPINIKRFYAPLCSYVQNFNTKNITHMSIFFEQFIKNLEFSKLEVLYWNNKLKIPMNLTFPTSLKTIVINKKNLSSYIPDSVTKIYIIYEIKNKSKSTFSTDYEKDIVPFFTKYIQKRIKNNSLEIINDDDTWESFNHYI